MRISSRVLGFSFVMSAMLSAQASSALTPAQCVGAYADRARGVTSIANTFNYGGRLVQLGATIAGSSSLVVPHISTMGTLGGSSLGTTGDIVQVHAQFASNVAQSAAESQGRVLGPFTSRMASDLNDAIYGGGRFGGLKNPLSASLRETLQTSLNGRRVSATDVTDATNRLLETGALCDVRGEPLTQDAWASLIVGHVTGVRYE